MIEGYVFRGHRVLFQRFVGLFAASLLLASCAAVQTVDALVEDSEGEAVAEADSSGSFERSDFVESDDIDVFSFAEGDCLTEIDERQVDETVSGGATVPCSSPHIYEVYHQAVLVSATQADAVSEAEDRCLEEFEGFIGSPWDLVSLEVLTLFPTEVGFAQGDRGATCLVHRADLALIEGSLAGQGSEYSIEIAGDFQLGDCWAGLPDEEQGGLYPSQNVGCDGPHVFEVFYEGQLEDGLTLPEQSPGAEICDEAYETFVGIPYESSVYFSSWYEPSPETYAAGDRKIACLIHTGDFAEIAGSLEGSNR